MSIYPDTGLTEQQLRVLKILSRNNEKLLQMNLQLPKEKIEDLINGYYQQKPILDDLESHGVVVGTLYSLQDPNFDEKLYIKAIPILSKWLEKDSLSQEIKSSILAVLITRKVSKQYAFEVVVNELRKLNISDLSSKNGFYDIYPTMLGNALTKWVSDEDASKVFELLKEEKLNHFDFLIASLKNFKKPENIETANKLIKTPKKR